MFHIIVTFIYIFYMIMIFKIKNIKIVYKERS